MSNELSPGGGGSSLNAAQILAKLTGATTLAVGAMLFGAGTALLTTLPPAANGLFLSLSGGVPTWSINPAGALPASYVIGDTLFASSASALSRLAAVAVGQVLVSNGVGVAPSWSASPSVTGIITAKPTTTAGIALDPNAATGNFLLSLSPANLTAARRWSFPDRSDTVAGLGAQTFTGAQTVAASSLTVTGSAGAQTVVIQNTSPTNFSTITLSNSGGTARSVSFGQGGSASGQAPFYLYDDAASATRLALSVAGDWTFPGTTDATSLTAAALVCNGGAAVAKTLRVGLGLILGADPGGPELLRVGGGIRAGTIGVSVTHYLSSAGSYSTIVEGTGAKLRVALATAGIAEIQATTANESAFANLTLRSNLTNLTGAVTIGADPIGPELLRIGGSLRIGAGTLTTAVSVLESTATWNAGAVAFTGIKLNVTDTASAAGSLLLDLQVGGVSKFSVQKDGAFTTAGTLTCNRLAVTANNTNHSIEVNQGTITSGAPYSILQGTSTWNNAAVNYNGIYLSITGTAYASSAALMFLVGGGSRWFRVFYNASTERQIICASAGALNTTDTDEVSCSSSTSTGFGGSRLTTMRSSVTTNRDASRLDTLWADATDATRKARYAINVADAAAFRECLRAEASGTAAMIGFLGAAASARITFSAWTGTSTRTAIATSTATLANVAEAVKAIVDDLRTFGLYG